VLATVLTEGVCRIDLRHVIGRYIGETEKNLWRFPFPPLPEGERGRGEGLARLLLGFLRVPSRLPFRCLRVRRGEPQALERLPMLLPLFRPSRIACVVMLEFLSPRLCATMLAATNCPRVRLGLACFAAA